MTKSYDLVVIGTGTAARYSDELMARIAPTAHRHINMRGILAFDLARHRGRLLPDARPLWAAGRKVAKA
jgi:hypothetical protein